MNDGKPETGNSEADGGGDGAVRTIAERYNAWRPGLVPAASLCGPVMGPCIGILEFTAVNDKGNAFVNGALAVVVSAALAGMIVILAKADGAKARWGRRTSVIRALTVTALGGALWALPGSWSIPSSAFAFPWDWLALSLPFPLVALMLEPAAARWQRTLLATPLIATALVWPSLCSSAAAQIRHRAGVGADAWFTARLDGYSAAGYALNPVGIPELGYHKDSWDVEYGDDLVLRSWPADTDSPCEAMQGFATRGGWECGPGQGGLWAAHDQDDNRFLAKRYGSRYVIAELPADAMFPIAAERLPAILASVHPADVHEQLSMANGY